MVLAHYSRLDTNLAKNGLAQAPGIQPSIRKGDGFVLFPTPILASSAHGPTGRTRTITGLQVTVKKTAGFGDLPLSTT